MDYRELLTHQFNLKRQANPRYSLRAFARDISISPSRLSEVMTGKGHLSRDKGAVIARKLSLPTIVTADFLDMIDADTASDARTRKAALSRISKRSPNSQSRFIDNNEFEIIADPKFVAIWSYMLLETFDGELDTIIRAFKINSIEVFDAVRRLERMELVRRDGLRWFAVRGQFTTGNQLPSAIIRAYHKQMAIQGQRSIEGLPMNARHLDSAIMPFRSDRMGEIQQKITAFTRALIDEFGDDGTGDAVFGLALQFFRMTDPVDSHNA